ncbi:SDR family oxidoreductase [Nocardioides marinquilinus]|uniref:SDR family oxidoreductase n=1 Tax=Nocardioides marinquilinus TaxID=1210400 RepID=A0ABP9PY00_9ACTN
MGRATVRELAARGYDVGVLARGAEGLRATADDVRRSGGRCVTVVVDVADAAAVDDAARQVADELGPIVVWVNNAFVGTLAWFWDSPEEEFRRVTEVTYLGQVNGMRTALKHMRPRDRGSIVNVSSALAHRSIPLQAAYCGAKHAIVGATDAIRTELKAEGSRVGLSLITLPGVDTPQFSWNLNRMPRRPAPVPPLITSEVAARAIVDVAERPRRQTWVGLGTVMTVLGGRFAPWFMDAYLARTGVESQQTDRPTHRGHGNLYEPSDEHQDAGAHGDFGDQARDRDPVSAVGLLATRLRARLAQRA